MSRSKITKQVQVHTVVVVFLLLFTGGMGRDAARLVGSQFPDQGLNLGHGSESTESYNHWTTAELPVGLSHMGRSEQVQHAR